MDSCIIPCAALRGSIDTSPSIIVFISSHSSFSALHDLKTLAQCTAATRRTFRRRPPEDPIRLSN
jgi:hypothetical protein